MAKLAQRQQTMKVYESMAGSLYNLKRMWENCPMRSFFLTQKPDRLRVTAVIVLAICVATAFIPLLDAGWVYDDVNLVRPSPALRSLTGLGLAISTDLYSQAGNRLEVSPYWRPLAMASYWLDTRFGDAPGALHAGNILLQAIAAALLALVVMRRHGGTVGIITA